MPGIVITGARSAIAQALVRMLPAEEKQALTLMTRDQCDMGFRNQIERVRWGEYDRLVLMHGAINGESFRSRSAHDLDCAMWVSLLSFIYICEAALTANPKARIVVMGSESARKGSHDLAYWTAKAGLHEYVRNRRLAHPGQQLVAVAPSAVRDSGMTRRKGPAAEQQLTVSHPKGRLATPAEVARLIYFVLFTDGGYISNTVCEINGGKFAGSGC